jgi:hypothetical protein
MPRVNRSTTIACALALVLALAVGACAQPFTVQIVHHAVAKTKDTGTARFEMVMNMSGIPGQSGDVDLTLSGEMDFKAPAMQGTMDLPGVGAIEMRMVDGTMYMTLPVESPKPWVKMDLSDLMGGASLQASTPDQALDQLARVSEGAHRTGTAEVRGTACTLYDTEVDMGAAMDSAPSAAMKKIPPKMKAGMQDMRVPVTVCLDDQDLLLRESMDFDYSSIASANDGGPLANLAGVKMHMTMGMFDFGVPVDISAPPADEVGDLADLMPGQ